IESGENWRDIFKLHWHTQPDYPWFLPCLNAWVYGMGAVSLNTAAQCTSVIFSMNVILLIWAGLRRYSNLLLSFLAALLLLTNPYFSFIGTAQYADIVLAHFLLISVISIIILS